MNWHWLTYFGDSMLLLPCAALILLMLLANPETRRATWQWMLLFGIAGGLVCLSKLAFMGWGIGSRRFDFTGFSGHSALSASIWPVLMWMLTGRMPRLVRIGAITTGYVLAFFVGYSRLVIHVHSPAEVVAGLVLGFTISTTFLMLQTSATVPRLSYGQLAMALVVPLFLINTGKVAPTQGLLERIAVAISPATRAFTRADLHHLSILTPPAAGQMTLK
ncbi:phosphatase PAP2 family protein [Chimaeribacter arupi]|uniref:Phosphatase PAP2 family protein n=2 Tax=Yersiniaceae TaxID=1903411 RepID=A0A2N5EK25_9GAMM|nr:MULTISPECIES: phosphatase PAP2 family protein [Yersiniaceae]MBS0967550.1 phosphatase PAP2 family protein [Nissabacter archeti]MDV5142154.1 phosphatase PAP2 family protein [Chimaeribacter arupi]PLR30920.1 phosphatase PAP2 family protein [Chimaeribacter arupi]PLR44410.1 phosphatase PAP2 family protein [Chimaeribacter arupi]PLR46451.1 phosphatase PAP2 family protein [Chimaeribacter arupi]